ncbi:PilW family protein [Quatrionicoccus australiensis]|uniref:PilW family protein n=1 Tax=Quatrionicoccus australiensis TaxID=138118 RepID=UPI001CF85A29|nr:PilW family protein [Quatrionicoccus australiensis]UCV16320.1 PilW family protein [Quatrionicoccus australiensis]
MMRRRNASRGFTLVELMVALVIALVAMLAAISLYVGTRQTYRIQGMQSRLSEDGRFAISMLQRLTLQAGFRDNPATAITAGYITPVTSSQFTVKFTGDNVNTVGCSGAAVTGAQSLTISENSTDKKLTCGAVDWIAPAGSGTELMDFLVEYGVDSGPNTTPAEYGCGADIASTVYKERDCVADAYPVAATALASMDKIVALRFCLVLRTEDTDVSVNKNAAYKDCSNVDIANSQTDHKLYRTFRTTVQVRNR